MNDCDDLSKSSFSNSDVNDSDSESGVSDRETTSLARVRENEVLYAKKHSQNDVENGKDFRVRNQTTGVYRSPVPWNPSMNLLELAYRLKQAEFRVFGRRPDLLDASPSRDMGGTFVDGRSASNERNVDAYGNDFNEFVVTDVRGACRDDEVAKTANAHNASHSRYADGSQGLQRNSLDVFSDDLTVGHRRSEKDRITDHGNSQRSRNSDGLKYTPDRYQNSCENDLRNDYYNNITSDKLNQRV